jgi:gamma-D-glutamyl-L-lysine dipeptidyl-peptidase
VSQGRYAGSATAGLDVPAPAEAIVVAAVAPMHAEPKISSTQISQNLAGASLTILEDLGDWLRVRGVDGYEGWMHQGYLARLSPALSRQTGQRPARVSLGAIVRDGTGTRRELPLGAALASDDVVESGEVASAEELATRFPTAPTAIARTAECYFVGASYQWGGVTPWGADCSGFVQTIYALHGVTLPRDAWQQALEGADAGRELTRLAPADLLFFSDRPDRHVTHVGLALGGGRMAHVALGRGGFALERLDDTGDAFVRKLVERFLFAKRILNGGL